MELASGPRCPWGVVGRVLGPLDESKAQVVNVRIGPVPGVDEVC